MWISKRVQLLIKKKEPIQVYGCRILLKLLRNNWDSKSQNMMHIFGHQQRVSVSVYHEISFFQHKFGRSRKEKKKWNQLQNFFQQQGRNPQGLVDKNGGNFNVNLQTKLRPQQGTATQWRGQSQNPSATFEVGNQFLCSRWPAFGQDQGPRLQNKVSGRFVGNFSQQPLPLPNFKMPPPNMPPMEFFRKVLPPNILPQTHPMIPQQLQPNPPIPPPQQVPPPPLRSSQSQFFPPSQPTPPPPPLNDHFYNSLELLNNSTGKNYILAITFNWSFIFFPPLSTIQHQSRESLWYLGNSFKHDWSVVYYKNKTKKESNKLVDKQHEFYVIKHHLCKLQNVIPVTLHLRG